VAEPSQARYALYYTPAPDSPLWRFGCSVIGYDSIRGCDVPPVVPEGWTADDWHEATAEPRRYGFHATLKAPFRLAAGRTEGELLQAVRAFSEGRSPVPLGRLRIAQLGSFVALVPAVQGDELESFAAQVVTAFEAFRAPLTAEDRERRKPETLPARERAHLDRYGYPYVLDAFRFHMTLAGPLPPARIAPTRMAIDAEFERLRLFPTAIHIIALCRQDSPEARFRVLQT
jgi:putative phosphonate metabolism protein